MNSSIKKAIPTYRLITMKRGHKRTIMILSDLLALPFALWSGYMLRLSDWWAPEYLYPAWPLFILTPLLGVFVFMRLGLYHAIIRFMGAQAIWAVVKGVMLLAFFLWAAATLLQVSPFPRSVPVIFSLVALVYVGGSRLLVRHYYHWLLTQHGNKNSVLIYGAGGAGVQLATVLSEGIEYCPVGFIDDDRTLWGSTIKGLPIYGPGAAREVIEYENVGHVLLALPSSTSQVRKKILESLEELNVHVQTIPSMPELLSGKAKVEELREVQVEDLLGRDPVPPKVSLLEKCIAGKSVMVTGAGGSIGSELCRQVVSQHPLCLVLFEVSEYNLYEIKQELENFVDKRKINVNLVALLGNVTDKARVERAISAFNVDTIYHAAAYKHVPLVEHNVIEGIKNNIFGTRVVAEAAAAANIGNFILVSTDKAVRPTNVMGATKRFSELILQNLAKHSLETTFSMVRFGNVLGSSGSVVPLFRKQIQAKGPVTVTHREITRYFMTIPEAASLVIQAGSMAKGGDVFVLDMGEPVKITDLAKKMIQLSGYEIKSGENPNGDIEIKYTGLRPAEKLYEELLVSENVVSTEHAKIMKANEDSLTAVELDEAFIEILKACDEYDSERLKYVLKKTIYGYNPSTDNVDYLSTPDHSNIVHLPRGS